MSSKKQEAPRFLSFTVGNELYAVPLQAVQEIIAVPAISPLYGVPSYFKGTMSLRGETVPVVDVSDKLSVRKVNKPAAHTAVIVLDVGGKRSLGVYVEAVNFVLTVERDLIEACPETIGAIRAECVSAAARVENKDYLLIDVEKAFSEDRSRV